MGNPEIRSIAEQDQFWFKFESLCADRSVFEGEDHGDIDFRLVENINDILQPELGDFEDPNSEWFHNLDFYGDGIRSLEFSASTFPTNLIPKLQSLLKEEHSKFCILCKKFDSLKNENPELKGCTALFSTEAIEWSE